MKILEITQSELRRKLLSYYFSNSESKLYLREIAITINEDPGNLSKELFRLEEEGLFCSKWRGNQKYFTLNKSYPLYKEFESIVFKTIGIEGVLRRSLEKIPGIKVAFIYGSFAKGVQNGNSDVDLSIIGEINEDKLLEEINNTQKYLKREINYTLYSQDDWDRMKRIKNTFTSNILNEPKIILKGGNGEL